MLAFIFVLINRLLLSGIGRDSHFFLGFDFLKIIFCVVAFLLGDCICWALAWN